MTNLETAPTYGHVESRTSARAVQRPKRSLWKLTQVPLLRIAIGVVMISLWELSSGRFVAEAFVSRPGIVAAKIWEIISDGTAWFHLERTAQEFAIGYVIGAFVAIIAGTILGRSKLLSDVVEPYLLAFYSIPKIALAPLFIIWLGIGIESKIAVVVISAFFMTFVNTYGGMKNVNEEFIHLIRVMGATRLQVVRHVLFPAASPNIIIGLRAAVPYGIIGAIIGEMIASNRGLGFYIVQAAGYLNTPALFAGLAVLVAVVMGVNIALNYAERRILVWRPSVGDQGVIL